MTPAIQYPEGFEVHQHTCVTTIDQCARLMLRRAQQSYKVGAMSAYIAERKAAIALFQNAELWANVFIIAYTWPDDITKAILELAKEDNLSMWK
jgi:hypothetical protein